MLAGCANDQRSQRPEAGTFHYPTSIVADPAGDNVYVVSTNFDSRYTGGTVIPIDVATATIRSEGTVEVGNFAGELAILESGGRGVVGLIPIRDDDNLEVLDIDRNDDNIPILSCGDRKADALPRCEPARRVYIGEMARDADGEIIDSRDPFAVTIGRQFITGASSDDPLEGRHPFYVASLLDGPLLVFTIGEDRVPRFETAVSLSGGIHSLIEIPLSTRERIILASNRMTNEIQVARIHFRHSGRVDAAAELPVTLNQLATSGDYFRGMALSRDGKTLYAVYRSPAALALFDMGEDGRPVPRGLVALYGRPGTLAVYAPPDGSDREWVYVTDFWGDAVYVVDPIAMLVVDRITVGSGPYGIAIAGSRAFVTDFEEGAVSVIEVDPSSARFHEEIARLK
jgi:YVTN family beta-propeller protein